MSATTVCRRQALSSGRGFDVAGHFTIDYVTRKPALSEHRQRWGIGTAGGFQKAELRCFYAPNGVNKGLPKGIHRICG
ncbi:hypothetical protein [Pusillimonas sp. NJUB218]|uniref:hypothetical protein n=1 Tax=Pusillimonas sp. NJUB218 TaxID=2023230 RepID=UPI000F4B476F|nr:hypothetical protein [Pusillimonas sp. NJUB218]